MSSSASTMSTPSVPTSSGVEAVKKLIDSAVDELNDELSQQQQSQQLPQTVCEAKEDSCDSVTVSDGMDSDDEDFVQDDAFEHKEQTKVPVSSSSSTVKSPAPASVKQSVSGQQTTPSASSESQLNDLYTSLMYAYMGMSPPKTKTESKTQSKQKDTTNSLYDALMSLYKEAYMGRSSESTAKTDQKASSNDMYDSLASLYEEYKDACRTEPSKKTSGTQSSSSGAGNYGIIDIQFNMVDDMPRQQSKSPILGLTRPDPVAIQKRLIEHAIMTSGTSNYFHFNLEGAHARLEQSIYEELDDLGYVVTTRTIHRGNDHFDSRHYTQVYVYVRGHGKFTLM